MGEVDLDEDGSGEMFELEKVDKVRQLQVALVDDLSTQVRRSLYSATDVTDVTDEFDDINDERDKLLLEMTEHVKKWKS